MYKPVDKDKVLRLVQMKGPVIPMNLKKDLETDSLLISAVLGQLADEGKVRVSSVKIGGSPTYYVPGTEERLIHLVKYLNEKDRRTAEMLEEKKVMKDSEQDPLVRVCLRNIKDYAKPLEVNVKGEKQVYWKWFLVPAKEAEDLIRKSLKPLMEEKPVPVRKEAPKVLGTVERKIHTAPVSQTAPSKAQGKQSLPASGIKDSPTPVEKKIEEKPKETVKKAPEHKETQTHLKEEVKPKDVLDAVKDAFFQEVRSYLEKNGIAIKDFKVHRKTEADLTVLVPTQIGSQEYFCKAKRKKKINDGDLSSAYIQGHGTKLPVIFLTPGDLTKKAQEMLRNEFKGMAVKRI